MFILLDRCETMRGSSPRPVKVDESRGALLGLALVTAGARERGCSTFGLDVNSEEIIWLDWRGAGAGAGAGADSWSSGARGAFRGRFAGRASAAFTVLSDLLGADASGRALRLATRLAFSLQAMRGCSRACT